MMAHLPVQRQFTAASWTSKDRWPSRYRTAARKFIHEVLNNGGWNEAHGVPYTRHDYKRGQITINRSPVALYDKIPAATSQQTFTLTPLGIDDASMNIQPLPSTATR